MRTDIPDLIAGALGVSRGTAYDMMREALAEAQQEPVAVVKNVGVTEAVVTLMWGVKEGDKFYTTPQAQPRGEATLAREPLTEWQPIETAQKHGEICVAKEFTPGRWTFNHAWWNQETEEWQDEYGDFVLTPTLWMPLPCAHGITKGNT